VLGGRFAVRNGELLELHSMVCGDHLRSFFSDHDGDRIGISADHIGHDAGISYAQIRYARDPELRIDHGADTARTGEVVNGEREMQREILQECIAWSCAFAVAVLGNPGQILPELSEGTLGPTQGSFLHIDGPAGREG
jgi:hypothetical protein